MNNIWLQIAAVVVLGMLAFRLYPVAKHWLKHGPKAQQGDWGKVLIPLAMVVGFILLMIMMVR